MVLLWFTDNIGLIRHGAECRCCEPLITRYARGHVVTSQCRGCCFGVMPVEPFWQALRLSTMHQSPQQDQRTGLPAARDADDSSAETNRRGVALSELSR